MAAASADPNLSARAAVLSAEVALAGDDLEGARRTAEEVLAMDGAAPDVRCHPLEIIGRSRRLHDLPAAAASFETALATAEHANLPVWRLGALHELGTVDMFERVVVDRLLEARRLGEQMGALSKWRCWISSSRPPSPPAGTSSAGTTIVRASSETSTGRYRELFVLRRVEAGWRISSYMFQPQPEAV